MRALLIAFALIAACGGGGDQDSDDDLTDVDIPLDARVSVDGPSSIDAELPSGCSERSQGECDPLSNQPCCSNQKCTWIWDSINDPSTEMLEPTVGHLGCSFAGPIPEAGQCVRSGPTTTPVDAAACSETSECGPGLTCIDSLCRSAGIGAAEADECERGLYCLAGTCKQVCDTAGDEPSCDETAACNRYSGIFISMGMTVAGVCDPKCDPLTQLTAGESHEACNSLNAANPSTGCYTTAGSSLTPFGFTCARVPPEAKGRTDRDPAYGPDSGGFYANGCEAGYLPYWTDATDETITTCRGSCAPLDADSSVPAAAVGDPARLAKLPEQPTSRAGDGVCIAGAKGSAQASDCRYLWPSLVDDMGNLEASPFNDTVGTCYPFSDRVYNHDADPATAPIPEPSCADLPPAGGDPTSTPHGITADELGCYSHARTTMLRPGGPRIHVVTATPGTIIRKHALR